MVKRYGNLWKTVISDDNLEIALEKAKKGKSKYTAVKVFEKNKAENLRKIKESLINKTFKTSYYNEKKIYEPKERTIYALPFYPDRIVQHALINVLEPIWVGMFIENSFACIKDRGIHNASRKTTEYVKKNKYCLKLDIRKFYPSINHDILFNIIKRKIKDKDVLWLIEDIIYSYKGETNVPIGNLTSQWFGNVYMHELDKFVKETLGIKDYLRYCDDFCLFSNNKSELNNAKKQIIEFLDKELKLTLSKCDLFQTSQGVDFMGYRHFRNYNLLRKSTAKRVKKRLPVIIEKFKKGKMPFESFRSTIESTIGWVQWANAYNFMKKTGLLEYKELLMTIKFSDVVEDNDKNLRKLEGNRVQLDDWLDKPIKITGYRIDQSIYKDKNNNPKKCIAIEFYSEGSAHLIFTSSSTLRYLISKYFNKDGLEAKIVKKDGQYILE